MLDSALEVRRGLAMLGSEMTATVSILIMLDSALEDYTGNGGVQWETGFNPNYAG